MIFYRSWQPVKALSFDLDDTLYDNGVHIRRAEQWLLDELKGLPETANLTAYDWQQYKRRVLQYQPHLAHDVSACRQAWLTLAFTDLGLAYAEQQAAQWVAKFVMVRSDFRVSQAVLQLLGNLKQQYRLLAITNGNVDVAAIGLSPYFELILRAGEQGQRAKPAADLYQRAASQLGLAHQQIAHVGDHVISDVSGAVRAGYRSIWLNQDGRHAGALRNLPDIEIDSIFSLTQLLR